jgi:hypothetical protein
VYGVAPATTDIVNQPSALLFDNRTYYIQSTMDVSYLASARTIYTVGGDGFLVRRQSAALVGVNGYNLRGTIQHRVSRATTLGVNYQHTHFDYPRSFGEANVDQAEGIYATQLSRRWTFSLTAGAYLADVAGIRQVAVDPAVQALLGVGFTYQAFSRKVIYPSGDAKLTRQFRTAALSFEYKKTVLPGNGVYLTSRSDRGWTNLAYTGMRKWNFSIGGGYYSLGSIGQGLPAYHEFDGEAGVTYGLTRSLHIVTRFDARHQGILEGFGTAPGYRHTGSLTSIGLAFSPGDVPLSIW